MDAETPPPGNVEHMFGADPKVVAKIDEILDIYRRGGTEVFVAVTVSPDGKADFRVLDAQGAAVPAIARGVLYLRMLLSQLEAEAWKLGERQKI